MKKNRWRMAALVLSGALILGQAIPTFAVENTEKGSDDPDKTETVQEKSDDPDKTETAQAKADDPDKTETVQAKADALGNVTKITVEDILKNPGGSAKIEDYSTLSDIKNAEGDEEFTKKSNGDLLWDNDGEDIQYKGTSDGELPVSVKVSYYLDGKEMTPEEIAGKSGKVRIRFDYENDTARIVDVDGKKVEVQVPFAVFSAMVLETDVFSNVEVTNGKIIFIGGQNAVVGYAFPGLEESLNLKGYEPTEDMDVPDYVEVTADVEKFELAFTATVVTNGIFQEIETEDLEDADELVDSMSDFTEASSKLKEGASKLSGGMETLQSYMAQYVDGVGAVNEGAKALADGLNTLNQQKSAIADGAAALTQGIATLNSALEQSDISGQLQSLAVQMSTYTITVQSLTSASAGELESVRLSDAESAANAIAREQAGSAVEAALAGIEGLTEEQKAQIREQVVASIDVSGVTSEAQGHVAAAKGYLDQIPVFDASEMPVGENSDVGGLLDSIQQLQGGSRQLADGIAAFNQGVEQLYAGSVALSEGTAELVTAGNSLNTGVDTLADGLKALDDGIAAFDRDGVQELGKLAGDDLEDVITRVKALKQADGEYDNFSGIREGQSGSVRFIIETAEIK